MLAQPEQAQLGRGLSDRQHPIVVTRAAFGGRVLHPPAVLAQGVVADDVKRRHGAEQQHHRHPEAKGNQHSGHGDQRDAVLEHNAGVFEESDGAVEGAAARPSFRTGIVPG